MAGAKQSGIDAVFSRRGWLARQPAEFRDALVGQGQLLSFQTREPICLEGDTGGGIYGIATGAIGCEMTTRLAGPTLIHIMRTGWWFGEGPALFDRQRTMSFRAHEPATVLLVPLHALRRLESSDGTTTRRLGQLAELGALLAIGAGCELLIPDARRRIAAVLLRVTAVLEGVGPDDPRGFRVTQSQLAEMSNVSRHHTNVVLLELQASGYVALDYGRIAVVAPDRLADFAGGISTG